MQQIGLFIHAPMQSWGGVNMPKPNAQAPRSTEPIPTKSALIGMTRSALGLNRGAPDELSLSKLETFIRVDKPGAVKRDYQVAQRSHHGFDAGSTREIPKQYLQDATFLVLLSHPDEEVLERMSQAFQSPQWAIFYGRRAHVPALPAYLGITETHDARSLASNLPLFWGNPKTTRPAEIRNIKMYDSNTEGLTSKVEQTNEPIVYDPHLKQYATNTLGWYHDKFTRPEIIGSTFEQYTSIKKNFGE